MLAALTFYCKVVFMYTEAGFANLFDMKCHFNISRVNLIYIYMFWLILITQLVSCILMEKCTVENTLHSHNALYCFEQGLTMLNTNSLYSCGWINIDFLAAFWKPPLMWQSMYAEGQSLTCFLCVERWLQGGAETVEQRATLTYMKRQCFCIIYRWVFV